jgi:hypothetical protein
LHGETESGHAGADDEDFGVEGHSWGFLLPGVRYCGLPVCVLGV